MAEYTEATGNISYEELFSDGRLLTILAISVAGSLGNNIASPALPAMASALNMTDASVGLVITAYTLPTVVMVPVVGVLADIYGRRPIVLPSLLLFGTAGTAISFANTFEMILVLRELQGVAAAGIPSLTVTLIGDIYVGADGAAARDPIKYEQRQHRDYTRRCRGLFRGGVELPVFPPSRNHTLLLLSHVYPPRTVTGRRGAESVASVLRGYFRAFGGEVRDRRLSLLLLGGGIRDFVKYALVTFVPLFAVRTLDATVVEAGAVLSARGLAGIVVFPISGIVVEKSSHRQALVGALGIAATGLVLKSPTCRISWLWGCSLDSTASAIRSFHLSLRTQ